MNITVIDDPSQSDVDPRIAVESARSGAVSRPEPGCDTDPVVAAVQRQAAAASAAARRVCEDECDAVDPQAWLFAERTRYRERGTCDPYAMLMLARAGLLPVR